MINELPFNHIILFFIFFLGNIVRKIHSYINFTYPYGISLSNGKIFVIHKFGICICDQNLSTIIKNVTEFTEEEELTDESLLRISSAYEYEYIIAIINYKIYIFNNTWNLLIIDNITLDSKDNDIYFSITPIILYETFYYYLISYVDYGEIRFLYYRFNIQDGTNNLINYDINDNNDNNDDGPGELIKLEEIDEYIKKKGLSCQYMSLNDEKRLICFYLFKQENIRLMIEDFEITSKEIKPRFPVKLFEFSFIEPKYIKSTINSDRDKALICVYSSENQFVFFGFDINSFVLELNTGSFDLNISDSSFPLGPFNRTKINYLKGKNDFVFSFNDESSIKLFYFSGDFNNSNITTFYKQDSLSFGCSNINDHVIL